MQTPHLLLTLGTRSLLRQPRRSLLTMLAIFAGVWSSVALSAIARGFSEELAKNSIMNLVGHVQLHASGYLLDPMIGQRFALPKKSVATLTSDPRVVGMAQRIRIPAVVLSEYEATAITLVGIDPAEERGVSFIGGTPIVGRSLAGTDECALIAGKKVLALLKSDIGRRLVVMTQGVQGGVVDRGFRVIGSFDTELESTERSFLFTGRECLAQLFQIGAEVSEVSILLRDRGDTENFAATLKTEHPELSIRTWTDAAPIAAALLKVQGALLSFWYLIVVIAVAIGLINTLFMAIFERIREIGLLQALGMSRRFIRGQFLVEAVILLTCGMLLGNLVAWGTVEALSGGIDISRFARGAAHVGLSRVVYPVVYVNDVLSVNLLIAILCFLGSLYPAWRASQFSPLEGMRQHG